jgi:phosphoenolpyruvate carboxylase
MREDSVAGTIKTLLTKVHPSLLNSIRVTPTTGTHAFHFFLTATVPRHHAVFVFQLTSSTSSQANKEEIYDALLLQKVDIVLTAHPTEVNRRTLLRKYKEISESLAKLDKKDLSPYEKSGCEEALRREIYSIWGSDEIRREKPTPQTEAKGEIYLLLFSAAQR